jgi:hypothetical protein
MTDLYQRFKNRMKNSGINSERLLIVFWQVALLALLITAWEIKI